MLSALGVERIINPDELVSPLRPVLLVEEAVDFLLDSVDLFPSHLVLPVRGSTVPRYLYLSAFPGADLNLFSATT